MVLVNSVMKGDKGLVHKVVPLMKHPIVDSFLLLFLILYILQIAYIYV